jgi:hypothetical protein
VKIVSLGGFLLAAFRCSGGQPWFRNLETTSRGFGFFARTNTTAKGDANIPEASKQKSVIPEPAGIRSGGVDSSGHY